MSQEAFDDLKEKYNVIPVVRRIMSDHLSPVLAYRRLVASDDRTAPSFLFESVDNGDEVGRFSFLGANPVLEIIGYENDVSVRNHENESIERVTASNPLHLARSISKNWNVSPVLATDDLPLPSFMTRRVF
jgi:anthranilate synthase component 1